MHMCIVTTRVDLKFSKPPKIYIEHLGDGQKSKIYNRLHLCINTQTNGQDALS